MCIFPDGLMNVYPAVGFSMLKRFIKRSIRIQGNQHMKPNASRMEHQVRGGNFLNEPFDEIKHFFLQDKEKTEIDSPSEYSVKRAKMGKPHDGYSCDLEEIRIQPGIY